MAKARSRFKKSSPLWAARRSGKYENGQVRLYWGMATPKAEKDYKGDISQWRNYGGTFCVADHCATQFEQFTGLRIEPGTCVRVRLNGEVIGPTRTK